MNTKEMTGNSQGDLKLASTARSRVRPILETVAEMSNEISAQCTERFVQSRGSANPRQSSPFVVEKIEYDLGDSLENMKVEPYLKEKLSLPNSFIMPKLAKKFKDQFIDKSVIDSEVETKFPANSYRTPIKPEKQDSFMSPKDYDFSSGKSGFFSMRRKVAGKPEALEVSAGTNIAMQGPSSANSKIKIVNNIFQNTFLQNYPKPDSCSTKRKIKDLKLDDKSKGAIRKKGNTSMEVKTSGKPSKTVSTVLSPQNNSNRTFSFHMGGLKPTFQKPQKLPTTKTAKNSTILEESVVSTKLASDPDRKFKSMVKFHEKLSNMINDVQGTEGDVDLKDAWRFVKDVVKGYAAATQKIKQLEAVLNSK